MEIWSDGDILSLPWYCHASPWSTNMIQLFVLSLTKLSLAGATSCTFTILMVQLVFGQAISWHPNLVVIEDAISVHLVVRNFKVSQRDCCMSTCWIGNPCKSSPDRVIMLQPYACFHLRSQASVRALTSKDIAVSAAISPAFYRLDTSSLWSLTIFSRSDKLEFQSDIKSSIVSA